MAQLLHPSPAAAAQALAPFDTRVVMRSVRMYRVLTALPWLLIAAAAVILADRSPVVITGPVLFSTGLIAAACAMLAFRQLIDRIPATLELLWERGIVLPCDDVAANADESDFDATAPLADRDEGERQRTRYAEDVTQLMNWSGAWFIGVIFVGIVFYYYHQQIRGLIGIVGFLFEASVALCIGFAAWRMLAIGWWRVSLDKGFVIQPVIAGRTREWRPLRLLFTQVRFRTRCYELPPLRFLGCAYTLKPQLRHPDRCGGLEPLAKLCLWNAAIISCAGIYLGGWIILANVQTILGHALWDAEIVRSWVPTFKTLLIWPVLFALLSFFAPIWGLHRIMLREREALRRELDELAEEIEQLARKMVADATHGPAYNATDGSADSEKLALLRTVYAQNYAAPAWPFNADTFIRLLLTETVPVLALAGVDKPVLDIIGKLTNLMGGG